MKLISLLILSLFLFASCGSGKNTTEYTPKKSNHRDKITSIVNDAKKFIGTRYRAGGTTKKGMDCSGLVYTTFNTNGIKLYRTSLDMSKQGKPIKTKEIKKGDLLFFKTRKSSRSVNHVGLVSKVSNGTIYFIHSSSSKGVIESCLKTDYWNKSFRFAKRIL